ncbi:MAG TPA: hypothetical protein VGS22_13175 [Thermoanaerobaculia bacterium]|nr:hypothetical protein [Thermoanaerobaculia bacterium]
MPFRFLSNRFARTLTAVGFAVLMVAPTPAARASHLLGEGAVVDAARGIAYLAQPQGEIEALDLATGKAVWRSAAAAKPLALADGVLLAQDVPGESGALRVATLDAGTGAEKGRTEIALPAGLSASVADTLHGAFRVRAAVIPGGAGASGGSSVVLAWTASAAPPRGFLPPEFSRVPVPALAPAAAARGFRRGAARLDLATGRATPAADSEVAGLAVAVDRSLAPGASADEEGAGESRGLTSIDGHHALTSERVAGSLHTYRWSISVRETGAVLAQLDVPVALAPFVVVGRNVVYLAQPSARRENDEMIRQPRRLRALDLATGNEAWQAVVRDFAYSGPIPP